VLPVASAKAGKRRKAAEKAAKKAADEVITTSPANICAISNGEGRRRAHNLLIQDTFLSRDHQILSTSQCSSC